jgi:3-phosphoshikimate 1-carboxyvinyltransferase
VKNKVKSVVIQPAPLHGVITPPPSKSAAHRAIICAALSKGESRIYPYVPSDDIDATIGVMRVLGAKIQIVDNSLYISGTDTLNVKEAALDCRESGSTLRFLIPVAASAGGCFTFTGSGRLPSRPIGPYLDSLPAAGIMCETTTGGLPLILRGELRSGVFSLPGNVSSQFITGLLLALPRLTGDSRIMLSSPLESAGYVELTIDMMSRFGVHVTKADREYLIKGWQTYAAGDLQVEGDWSQAAFWLAAGALGGHVACERLNMASNQGDMAISALLHRFGAVIVRSGGRIEAQAGNLHGIEIDASQIPDLVPVLAAASCFASGRTVIKNAARLRIKESDRLHTTTLGLRALGAQINETENGLVIDGGRLRGGETQGAGDHRIVMALSIAAAFCEGTSVINGCECVSKSYPEFFRDFKLLGGIADVIDMG